MQYTLPPVTINDLLTTKEEWVRYVDTECKDKEAKDWFARCFSAKMSYYEWLRVHHPREYMMEMARQSQQVIDFKNRYRHR